MSLPSNKSYLNLINEAILTSNKRTGTSLQAIKQYILSQYPDLDLKNVIQIYLFYFIIYF